MKRIAILLLLSAVLASAEQVTLSKSAILRADRSMVSLKAGTVVQVISRDETSLTVRYQKTTGTIPAASVGEASGAVSPEALKKMEVSAPPPSILTAPPASAPARKAQTTYGKAVEKARENAGKHEQALVKPADEILPN